VRLYLLFLIVQDPIEKKKPSDLGYQNLFEVTDKTPEQVKECIETIAAEAISEVLEGNGLRYTLAQRGTGGHTQYVEELDRNYLEYRKMMREFADASQVKKTTMMTRLMQLVREMCVKGIHSTKRDLFYADVKLFEKQGNSDGILEELAVMFGCTRQSLMVTASEKGVVVGRIQFNDDDDVIDCTKMGRSGKNIPSYIDRVSNIRSDFDRPAEFILLVPRIHQNTLSLSLSFSLSLSLSLTHTHTHTHTQTHTYICIH
jgi:meiotic recombination protein SPO11